MLKLKYGPSTSVRRLAGVVVVVVSDFVIPLALRAKSVRPVRDSRGRCENDESD